MDRKIGKSIGAALVAVLAALLAGMPAHSADQAQQPGIDIILLIDISASMPLGDNPALLQQRIARFRQWMQQQGYDRKKMDEEAPKATKGLSWEFEKFRQAELEKFKEELRTFVGQGLLPASNVTLITFGTEAERRATAALNVAAERQNLLNAVAALKANDTRSYISKGLFEAQKRVAELIGQQKGLPPRFRHVVLITDGGDNPPVDKALPPKDQLAAWEKELAENNVENLKRDWLARGIAAQKDFFLWYAHFGPPDPALKACIEKLDGRAVEIKNLRFGHVAINPNVLLLPPQPAQTNWGQAFPTDAGWLLGERLTIDPGKCQDVAVRFGPLVEIEKSPEGAAVSCSLEVAPEDEKKAEVVNGSEIRLKGASKASVRLTFSGKGFPPGTYTGRLPVRPEGGLVFPAPPFLQVRWEVAVPPPPPPPPPKPEITIWPPKEDWKPGRATLAEPAEWEFRFQLNEAARQLASPPQVHVGIELKPMPPALLLEIGPKGVTPQTMAPSAKSPERRFVTGLEASEKGPICIRATVRPKLPHPMAGRLAGKLLFQSATPGVEVTPTEIPLDLQLAPVLVELKGDDIGGLNFKAGEPFEKTVSYDAKAVPAGTTFELMHDAPRLEPPNQPNAANAPELTVGLKMLPGRAEFAFQGSAKKAEPGEWRYAVPIRCKNTTMIAPKPEQIVVTIRSEPPIPELEKRDFQIRLDMSEEGKAQVRHQLSVRFKPDSLPPTGTVRLKINDGNKQLVHKKASDGVSGQAPGVELELTEFPVSRSRPEFDLPLVISRPCEGVWSFPVPIALLDGKGREFDRLWIELIVRGPWDVAPPGFITPATRRWPFRRVEPFGDETSGDPAQYRFEFQLPDQDWIAVKVEANQGGKPGLLIQSPEVLPPLSRMSLGDSMVRFRLIHRGNTVKEWPWPVRVVPSILQPPSFVRVYADDRMEPVTVKGFSASFYTPLRLDAECQMRKPIDVPATVKKRKAFVLWDRTSSIPGGPASMELIDLLRKNADSELDPKENSFRMKTIEGGAPIVAVPELLVVPHPEYGWRIVWDIIGRRWGQYCVIVAFYYDDTTRPPPNTAGAEQWSAEEWSDVYLFDVIPWYVRWFRPVAYVMGVLLLVGLAWAGKRKLDQRSIPPLEKLISENLALSSSGPIAFEPKHRQGNRANFEKGDGWPWYGLRKFLSSRREAWTIVIPTDPGGRQDAQKLRDAAQRIRVAVGRRGPEIWTSHGAELKRDRLKPKQWHPLPDAYVEPGEKGAGHYCGAELVLNFSLPGAGPGKVVQKPAKVDLKWKRIARPRAHWTKALFGPQRSQRPQVPPVKPTTPTPPSPAAVAPSPLASGAVLPPLAPPGAGGATPEPSHASPFELSPSAPAPLAGIPGVGLAASPFASQPSPPAPAAVPGMPGAGFLASPLPSQSPPAPFGQAGGQPQGPEALPGFPPPPP